MRLVEPFEVDNAESNVKLLLLVKERQKRGSIYSLQVGERANITRVLPCLSGTVLRVPGGLFYENH